MLSTFKNWYHSLKEKGEHKRINKNTHMATNHTFSWQQEEQPSPIAKAEIPATIQREKQEQANWQK